MTRRKTKGAGSLAAVWTLRNIRRTCTHSDPGMPQSPYIGDHMTTLRCAALCLCALLIGLGPGAAQTASDRQLSISTGLGTYDFDVEVMRTEAELERGLMFRRQMPKGSGMLFDFKAPHNISMWMKNTYLSLDMVFIAKDGRVISVRENAEPLSEDVIPSGGAALAVLEVNAGTAKRIGLRPGNTVHHPLFGP